MNTIYTNGQYLESTRTWHSEDSLWKAAQISKVINRNQIQFFRIAEIGCGAGAVLEELSKREDLCQVRFKGYDISPQAIELAKQRESNRVQFTCEDLLSKNNTEHFDALLAIDVYEHIPDYMGFLSNCRMKADYKIYHIPLDLHVSSVLRNAFINNRYTLGHLHYFTADSAIATLEDTGHEIIDYFYTNAANDLFKLHPSFKKALANVPRLLFSKIHLPITARVLGGYSLLVLTK